MPEISSAQQAALWADNLWLAVAHSENVLADLQESIAKWLRDKHPALGKRSIALHIVSAFELRTFLDDHPYSNLEIKELLIGKTGLYGPFGRYAGGLGRIYLDCISTSVGVSRKRKERTPDGGVQYVQVDGEGEFDLADVIADNSKASLGTLANRIEELDAIELFYLCAVPTNLWKDWARFGGTGLLEPYPVARSRRSSVHGRNVAVVESSDASYRPIFGLTHRRSIASTPMRPTPRLSSD